MDLLFQDNSNKIWSGTAIEKYPIHHQQLIPSMTGI